MSEFKLFAMKTVTYSLFRSQLAKFLDQVNEDHQPVLVTRQNGKPSILMSLEDFHAYEEIAYLLACPENARRLGHAIEEIEAGKVRRHRLLEE